MYFLYFFLEAGSICLRLSEVHSPMAMLFVAASPPGLGLVLGFGLGLGLGLGEP